MKRTAESQGLRIDRDLSVVRFTDSDTAPDRLPSTEVLGYFQASALLTEARADSLGSYFNYIEGI